jgi:hypothetical protein
MRSPIPREDDFRSRLRTPAVAARVGLWLGICFGVAFVTGLISHYAQQQHQPVPFPTSPSWGYQVTQGLHVIAGTAAVPHQLVKLWTVFPKLFTRPPRRITQLALHGAERASIGVLVAAAIFQLASGLANTAQWYPWHFHFRATHYALGWVAIGALLVHVAVKLPLIRAALGADVESNALDRPAVSPGSGVLSRRGLLRTTWGAAGVVTLTTAGISVPWLRRVSVLGVRSGEGPQDVPINKSAAAAGVLSTATSAAYRLSVLVGDGSRDFSLDELRVLPQTTASLPIACVEGWSAGATWTGVRLRDLLDHVHAPRGSDLVVRSLQPSGPFRVTVLPANFADDPRTLVALQLGGQPLSIDHGFPCRLIAPDRPGVLQTKWLDSLEVRT